MAAGISKSSIMTKRTESKLIVSLFILEVIVISIFLVALSTLPKEKIFYVNPSMDFERFIGDVSRTNKLPVTIYFQRGSYIFTNTHRIGD